MNYIYKICPADIWSSAEKNGVFLGAGIGLMFVDLGGILD